VNSRENECEVCGRSAGWHARDLGGRAASGESYGDVSLRLAKGDAAR
jgi:hypothetical protein